MLQVLFTLILLSASAIAAPSQAQAQLQVAAQQRASDLDYSPIKSVTDETRYLTLNPGTKLDALDKVKHSKNNIVFSSCERITGKLLCLQSLSLSLSLIANCDSLLYRWQAAGEQLRRRKLHNSRGHWGDNALPFDCRYRQHPDLHWDLCGYIGQWCGCLFRGRSHWADDSTGAADLQPDANLLLRGLLLRLLG